MRPGILKELQVLTMGLSDMGLYVFFRKYMCGVDVPDKGCGGIHVQVYVGCRVFEVVKSNLCVSVPVLDDFTPAVLRTVRLQIVASLLPWNSKAVGSAPDQTATFPEKSLVRLLAVVVRVDVGIVGSHWLYICIFVDPYECVATIV